MSVTARFGAMMPVMILLLSSSGLANADAPDWAFLGCPTSAAPAAAEKIESLPGSTQQFPSTAITERSAAIDWFPQTHGPMPAVVAEPRRTGQIACGYCHLPDGAGRPENAKLAGLPQDYIIRQIEQMRVQERNSALAGYRPLALMRASLDGLTPEDIQEAARYYEQQRPRSFERVIEATRAPASTSGCFVLLPARGVTQRLGNRIVELADRPEQFELRDPRTTYTAYVPPGSLRRGRALVSRGRAGLAACAGCHGADLRGGNGVAGPPIAGRFTGYLVRQLYGFRGGTRNASAAQSMQAEAAALSDADIIDAAAYAASLAP